MAGAGTSYRARMAQWSRTMRRSACGGGSSAAGAQPPLGKLRQIGLPAGHGRRRAVQPVEQRRHRQRRPGHLFEHGLDRGPGLRRLPRALQDGPAGLPAQQRDGSAQGVEQGEFACLRAPAQFEGGGKRLARLVLHRERQPAGARLRGLRTRTRGLAAPGRSRPAAPARPRRARKAASRGARHGLTPSRLRVCCSVSLSRLSSRPSRQTPCARSRWPRLHSTSPRCAAISASGRPL